MISVIFYRPVIFRVTLTWILLSPARSSVDLDIRHPTDLLPAGLYFSVL